MPGVEMPRKALRVVGMTPFQALITERMREKGWAPADVEARGVAHSTLHRYMQPTPLLTLPRPAVLNKLAKALDLSVEQLRAAAMETVGGPAGGTAHGYPPWRGVQGPYAVRPGLSAWILVERSD